MNNPKTERSKLDENLPLIGGFIWLLFFVLIPGAFILIAATMNGGNIQ